MESRDDFAVQLADEPPLLKDEGTQESQGEDSESSYFNQTKERCHSMAEQTSS